MRDRIACALCNFILRHVASAKYAATIEGSIRYGLTAAAKDVYGGPELHPPPLTSATTTAAQSSPEKPANEEKS